MSTEIEFLEFVRVAIFYLPESKLSKGKMLELKGVLTQYLDSEIDELPSSVYNKALSVFSEFTLIALQDIAPNFTYLETVLEDMDLSDEGYKELESYVRTLSPKDISVSDREVVVVCNIMGDTVNVYVFQGTEEGNRLAEKKFTEHFLDRGGCTPELDDRLDDGFAEFGDGKIIITHEIVATADGDSDG